MGRVKAEDAPQSIPLPAECLVGRSSACALRVDRADISNEHASLRWSGKAWELRDLGSRNGTYVNGVRLQPGLGSALQRGALIGFGTTGAQWLLVDDGPPLLAALELGSNRWICAEGGVLGLPDDEAPLVTLLHVSEGGWICQSAQETRAAHSGEVLTVGSLRFRLHLPTLVVATADRQADGPLQTPPRLSFAISRDEEYVELSVAAPGLGERSLGARAHHYVLLTLARLRARDAANHDLAQTEHGWVHLDELAKMMQLDRNHLYVTIHRARRQLADAGVPDASSVVQYRPRTGMVRLGFRDFELHAL